MQDYEYAGLQRQLSFRAARRVLVPDAIPVERMRRAGAARATSSFRYPGLKEDYYLADFEPDPAVLDELGIDPERGARGRPPAARDLRLPPPTTRSTTRCSTGSPPTGDDRGRDPAHRGARRERVRARRAIRR